MKTPWSSFRVDNTNQVINYYPVDKVHVGVNNLKEMVLGYIYPLDSDLFLSSNNWGHNRKTF